MKKTLFLLTVLTVSSFAYSQNPFVTTAPVQDGVISNGEYPCNSGSWYMAWDGSNLYIAETGGSTGEPGIAYFAMTPNSSANGGVASGTNGQTGGKNDYNVTPNLPFTANARVYFRSDYAEVTINTGSGWGSPITANVVSDNNQGSSTVREVKIPWNTLTNNAGMPTAFDWLGTGSSTGNPGYIYNSLPSDNYSGNSTTSPTYYYYQTVDSTANGSATNPCSASKESYTNYNNASYVYTSSLPTTLFDFTLGNTANAGNTTLSTNITIGRDAVIKNGIINATGSETISMTNAAGNFFCFTSSGGHIYGTDNGTGNDLNLSVNTGATTTFGGDAGTTNSDDHKFFNITIQSTATLALGRGILSRYGSFSCPGTLQINAHGFVEGGESSAIPVAYSGSSTLIYNNGGPYTSTDFEWPTTSSPTNVTIQNAGTNVTLNDSKTVSGTLTLTTGQLIIASNTLTCNGAITVSSGNLSGTGSSILSLGGSSAQALNFASGGTSLLTLNVGKSGGTATLNSALTIYSGIVFTGNTGTLNLNAQNLTLKSLSTGTAYIGTVSGTLSNATNVTAERYIPVNTTSPRTGKAWRLVTAPVTGQTINAAWQEGEVYDGTNNYITGTSTVVTPAAGYGTLITGQQQGSAATANSNGYDYWSAISNASTSILRYAQGTPYGSWAVLPNGTRTNALSTEPGYLLYVRGDRTVSTASTGSATTLRATGTVNQGTQSITVAGSSTAGFTLIGNPFASTINFETIYTNNSSKIQNYFYVWDANLNTLGGYILVTRNSANNYTAVPASGSDGNVTSANAQYIQSGQAFFVIPTGTTGTTLTIQESDKTTSNNNNVLFLPKNVSPVTTLNINLNLFNSDSSVLLADGALVKFTSGPKKQVAANISKAYNFLENLSLYQDTNYLIVGGYKMPTAKDTIHLKLWGTSQRNYQLSFSASNADSLKVKAYLFDSYTGTKSPIDLSGKTTTIDFSVTSDAASQSIDRFCIVFKKDKTQTATDITQTQPTEDKSIVELKAYPNPVQSSSFTLSVNSLAAGRYTISMYSPAGKMLQTQEADHKGGALSQSVNIPKGWVNGQYQVSISNEKGEIIKTVPVILGRF